MLGGYQILDLRAIDLTVSTSASNIADANVLKQLRELRNHIQKDYNFAKPLNNQLKPVLIRYRDKKNGEKHEVALYGNLEVLTNYYTFKINAIGYGEKLSIEVVFEEKTDEYENKYWGIKTAKILLSVDEAIGGDLEVTGDASIGGDLEVTGSINGEEDPSVKPIYWHGLDIYKSGSNSVGAHVLKNDDTPIDTIDKLIEWVESVSPQTGAGNLLLGCSGVIVISNIGYTCYRIRFNTNNGLVTGIIVYYATTGGYSSLSMTVEEFKSYFTTITDAINKIN